MNALLALLAICEYSSPVKLLPALFESFLSFIPSGPTTLSLDYIRLNIKHASNNLPGEQISFRPSIRIFDNVSQSSVNLKPGMNLGPLLGDRPTKREFSQPLSCSCSSIYQFPM